MQFAASVPRNAWAEGAVRSLPVPWPSIASVMSPRGGQCVIVMAAPGVGKTMFTAQWVAQARMPTLYCSADTGPKDMSAMLASLATGHLKDDVEQRMTDSARWSQTYADAIRHSYPHLVMDFASAPRLDMVAEKAEALCDVWGEPPAVVVIDTASDIARTGEGFEGWQDTWLACRDLSRYFNATFIMNHHVKQGPAASGNVAPTQGDAMYKADQFAEIVASLHRGSANEVIFTILKHRGGKSQVPFPLKTEYERARLIDETTWNGVG